MSSMPSSTTSGSGTRTWTSSPAPGDRFTARPGELPRAPPRRAVPGEAQPEPLRGPRRARASSSATTSPMFRFHPRCGSFPRCGWAGPGGREAGRPLAQDRKPNS
eukprot:6396648-Prymnesium_polylepis.1